MSFFVEHPLAAFVPALGFLIAGWRLRRLAVLCSGWLWLIYALYELGVHARILCSGECNIRIDLLAIYPVLVIVTLLGVWNAVRGGRETRAGN